MKNIHLLNEKCTMLSAFPSLTEYVTNDKAIHVIERTLLGVHYYVVFHNEKEVLFGVSFDESIRYTLNYLTTK